MQPRTQLCCRAQAVALPCWFILEHSERYAVNRMPTLGQSLFIFLLPVLLLSCARPEPPTISLYRAIQAGDLNQIKRHLHHDTDINQVDREGQMPLHVAAERGRLVISRMLIDHGAQLDAHNRSGHTALEVAVLSGKIQVAQLLRQRGATLDAQSLLFKAIRADANFRDVFEFLVRQGADVNAPDDSGDTPLVLAARLGHRLLVKRLIDSGADVNLPSTGGLTPLGTAEEIGNRDIIRLLKNNGAIEPENP